MSDVQSNEMQLVGHQKCFVIDIYSHIYSIYVIYIVQYIHIYVIYTVIYIYDMIYM